LTTGRADARKNESRHQVPGSHCTVWRNQHVRPLFAFLLLAWLALPCAAQDGQPGWIADPKTSCRIWNSSPERGNSIRWSGECRDGLAHGQGTLEWFIDDSPSSRFEGEYRDGQLNGRGIYVFANGDRYEGEYADDMRSGRGTFIYADGTRYEGEWRNDFPHGQGTLKRSDGTVFSGSWTTGCFRQDGKEATVISSKRECGFQ
jgi:hypothetical protein